MPTNPGSLFMGIHPPSAVEGAEAVPAAQGSMATCEDGQPGWQPTSFCTVVCRLSTSLPSYCFANKISNWYLKSKKDPHFCHKAGDFFSNKAWHTKSWFCTTEWVKAAGTETSSCQQDCSEVDMPLSKQRAILLGADRFECVCTSLCQSFCSLTFAVDYQMWETVNQFLIWLWPK